MNRNQNRKAFVFLLATTTTTIIHVSLHHICLALLIFHYFSPFIYFLICKISILVIKCYLNSISHFVHISHNIQQSFKSLLNKKIQLGSRSSAKYSSLKCIFLKICVEFSSLRSIFLK